VAFLSSEKVWVVSQEIPPEGSGRQLVDITIEYLSEGKDLEAPCSVALLYGKQVL
jgi:hypothetical protein